MAPSTPPPPRRPLFAALTIASTSRVVMSARTISMTPALTRHLRIPIEQVRSGGPGEDLSLAHAVCVVADLLAQRTWIGNSAHRQVRRRAVRGEDPDGPDALKPLQR